MTHRTPHSSHSRHRLPIRRLSRRQLIGGALAVGVLAACGDSSDDDGDDAGPDTFTLVQRFPQGLQVPGTQRLPISLSTGAAELISDGPGELGAQVVDVDGNPIGGRITAVRRDTAPAAYYDFHPALEAAGFYALVVEGGPADGASFQVAEPADVPVPIPGQPLPPFDTPTVADGRGVDPICTREPEACPFHEVTLTEALAAGRPVAYYVGTPAFCSTGSCAPALESLIEAHGEFGDTFTFVHAEVYTDLQATDVAPAVAAVGMTYEPSVFVTDADGIVVDRLDAVWDTSELVEVLRRVSG